MNTQLPDTAPGPYCTPKSALLLPHPAMNAAQLELLCRRQALVLAHLGFGRLVLVQTYGRRPVELRIARPDPEAA